ncbi:hypothetical protein CHS0354_010580 [Potamilus streckersoni]|uniref:Solute carrier family 35 member B1 n=1 Tax=Potamilus streckersoni TaxID=2493646 RepID=A0AAE0S603_9BIVA|nr:hypothetical protein CHS0354_010580 [Potamilus streckersoni]
MLQPDVEVGTKVDAHFGKSNTLNNNQTGMAVAGSSKKLLAYAFGIFFCYFYYGILQESITKGKYGDGEKKEKFTYTISLVFIQCIINTMFAWIVLNFNREHDTTPKKYYAACSLSYLGAMVTSNHALQHVSYPTQVLGKSAKPIPVMVLGILLAQKRYPAAKFLFVLMIVIGVALFLYKDKPATVTEDDSSLFGIGEVLLLVSLTLDGLTGATQDKMRAEHKTGGYSMMASVNLWSLLWLAIGLVLTGELWTFPEFVQRYPSVLIQIVTFGIASALGQMFIFLSVANFGPLTCSIITTTRKFFTILGSVIIFQNPMSAKQWIGTVFVFAGLSLDSVYGKEKKNK